MTTAVESPPLQPPVITLIRAARDALAGGRDETNGRWINGFAYLPDTNAALGTFGPCQAVDLSAVPPNAEAVTWQPYIVWAGVACSSLGWRGFDWEGRAQRLLDVARPKAIEREFWGGFAAQADPTLDDNLFLAMPSVSEPVTGGRTGFGPVDLTPAGGAPTMRRAFGMLEQAIADYGLGARGVIHCRPEAIPHFTGVKQDGNLLVTPRDTIVVPGTGYPDRGPGGAPAAAGNTWLYATGLVDVRVDSQVRLVPDPREDSPDFDNEWLVKAMDRDRNLIVVRAEQFAVASWDGQVHFAVQAVLET